MKRGWISLAIGLLAVAPLSASCCTNTASNGLWNGSAELGAHALYWRASDCTVQLASSQLSSPIIEQALLRPDYNWGYRVFAGGSLGCLTISGTYDWFHSTDTARSNLPLATGVDGVYDRVVGQLSYKYQHADLRIGHALHRRCGCDFSLYAVARWVDMERNTETEGFSPEGDGLFLQRSTSKGAGLGAGTEGSFAICGGLEIAGGLDLMGLIIERKTPVRSATSEQLGTDRNYFYPSVTAVIPAFDMNIALRYSLKCGCFGGSVEIGYEIQQYWEALAAGLAAEPTRRRCEDVGFTGLYLGGRLWF